MIYDLGLGIGPTEVGRWIKPNEIRRSGATFRDLRSKVADRRLGSCRAVKSRRLGLSARLLNESVRAATRLSYLCAAAADIARCRCRGLAWGMRGD